MKERPGYEHLNIPLVDLAASSVADLELIRGPLSSGDLRKSAGRYIIHYVRSTRFRGVQRQKGVCGTVVNTNRQWSYYWVEATCVFCIARMEIERHLCCRCTLEVNYGCRCRCHKKPPQEVA